jgi:hypothetical protein
VTPAAESRRLDAGGTDVAKKMTRKQAAKTGALVRKGLPKKVARRIAKPKR